MRKRKCIVCGKEYEYCSHCRDYAEFPAWKAIYDTDNCRNIMNIATDFMAGVLTKANAKARLDECDLSNKKNFKESVLKAINEIHATQKKSSKSKVIKEDEKPIEEGVDSIGEVEFE